MFRKTLIFFASLAFFCGVGIFLLIFTLGKKQEDGFLLLQESAQGEKKGNFCEQCRLNVSKEIFFRDEGIKAVRISSKSSDLFFFYEKEVAVMEQLQDVVGAMQEELMYLLPSGKEVKSATAEGTPIQYVRVFKAKTAHFDYNSSLFTADDVEIWKYKIEGHTLPSTFEELTPLMQGKAKSAQFSLKGDQLNFQAVDLKATFIPKRALL